MTDTKFVCSVCGDVFSEHRASTNPIDPEEDQIMCPNCGSARVEPDHFDPDEPVENPFEEPEEGHGT
jgi:DNA-directed RNA polymerase subunit RPC12/RpoP